MNNAKMKTAVTMFHTKMTFVGVSVRNRNTPPMADPRNDHTAINVTEIAKMEYRIEFSELTLCS